jgi:hypothetical protein
VFKRYAIFYTPQGGLADWGARWLGWDSRTGRATRRHALDGIDVQALTRAPSKYGLHGTLKAPFALAGNADSTQLAQTAESFARTHAPVDAGPFEMRYENGFIALRPRETMPALRDLATQAVRGFDPLRAPLSDDDIARRRRARLSLRQDQQMLAWGYPFIFEDFHFHLTLTGRLPAPSAAHVIAALEADVQPVLPARIVIDAITVMGEDANGLFHQLHRCTLTR